MSKTRTPPPPRLSVDFSVHPKILAQLEEMADERDMTVPELAKELMMMGLSQLKYKKPLHAEPHLKGVDPSGTGYHY